MDAIFGEIKARRNARRKRVREADKVKRHLRVVLIDLWAASKLSFNPYRAISKNKSDYQRGSRYRQIFLKYDYLIGVINDLCGLGYVEERLGFRFAGSKGRRTRIKATEKLIEKIQSPEHGINSVIESRGLLSIVGSDGETETIFLMDSDDIEVEYEDTEDTTAWRENLKTINNKLKSGRIALKITDQQYADLVAKINSERDPNRRTINLTNVQLHRVFNNSSWEQGGRFYGGWWQNIPKEYRKYIEINHGQTTELDYSGHHIRILYAQEGLDPPDDPYDLDDYDRDKQKVAVLMMLNAYDLEKALKAMAREGINGARKLANALTERHEPIKRHFFTGAGLGLMYQDSIIAEEVMLRMIQRGSVMLPVHDSFIVRSSYCEELEEIMKEVFERRLGRSAQLKYKKTALDEYHEEREQSGREFVTDDLAELLGSEYGNYGWYLSLWR